MTKPPQHNPAPTLSLISPSFREYEEEDVTYIQCVSAQPASRFDVITLQEQLDRRMAERKARESGICVVREQLYGQCFSETPHCCLPAAICCRACLEPCVYVAEFNSAVCADELIRQATPRCVTML